MTLDYVATIVQDQPIYLEAALRKFQRDTVDNFIDKAVDPLKRLGFQSDSSELPGVIFRDNDIPTIGLAEW